MTERRRVFYDQGHQIFDFDEALAQGRLHRVKDWLTANVHIHGRRWSAEELCAKVTGQPLSAEPLMRHLKERFAAIYGL